MTNDIAREFRSMLNDILLKEQISTVTFQVITVGMSLDILFKSGMISKLIPSFRGVYNYNQNNPHHKFLLHEHIISVVENTPLDLELRLAALFHDVAKPLCESKDEQGISHFFGHDLQSSKLAIKEMTRLGYEEQTIKNVAGLIRHHMKIHNGIKDRGIKKILKDIGNEQFEKLLQLFYADIGGKNCEQKDIDKIENVRSIYNRIKEMDING